ncbi:MAG: membrane protein insertion efficiency factor YidD [Deltaproteobacteria bacterium]|nr:membrane protein insertion efficiency factor YidD [Deltaproteobacteria bacterium]
MKLALIFLIRFYQFAVSPILVFLSFLGLRMGCRYPISCSEFARDEIQNSKSLMKSLYKISIRLMSCGPWQHFFRPPKGI